MAGCCFCVFYHSSSSSSSSSSSGFSLSRRRGYCWCCCGGCCSWSPLVALVLLITLQSHPCLAKLLSPAQQHHQHQHQQQQQQQHRSEFASKYYLTGSDSSTTTSAAEDRQQHHGGGGDRGAIGDSRRQLLFRGFGQQAPRAERQLADGIKVDLMHRDHVNSPLRSNSSSSLEQRIRQDAQRSALRSRALFYGSRMQDSEGRPTAQAQARAQAQAQEQAEAMTGPGRGSSTVQLDNFESPLLATLSEYVMSLTMGTPPQRFVAVVDTGSDLTWLQCAPCSQCFQQPDALFDPARSGSYRALSCADAVCSDLDLNLEACSPNCQYSYSYGDSSTTRGDFSSDTVTLATTSGGTREVANFAFGCGHSNQGTFSATDGLVGLGQGAISFASQLGALYGDKFSYCLVSREEALSQTSPLLFGDAAVPMVASGLQYTPMLSNRPGISSFYYVGLDGLSVGGAMLNIPASVFQKDAAGSGGVVFDSGTTFTQLVPTAFDAVIRAFQLALPYKQVSGSPNVGLDLCFDIGGVQNVVVPELTFHFTGANFDLPAENFFVLVDNAGTMCLAIARSKSPLNIFGNTQQQNFQILYDRSNARIGFTPLLCDSLR
ncbi:aspartyl protease family protein [Marchantia polymorpha subsp. ruderalis]|uniref:Peptidase A1 domain-containing protein n=1 Tax=Marchantia polymorpha subsp. ruderalis TaxID=1480154 RepID=A0AAF6BP17_MARPO|nr:hypothetical protein Mp_6g06010 [Marchantia polymorpha subsp. ruderalis]